MLGKGGLTKLVPMNETGSEYRREGTRIKSKHPRGGAGKPGKVNC